jgi:hypothetical protein
MALFEGLLEEGVGGPLVLGVGALVLAPRILPALGRILRPMAKGVIKTGITLYDQSYAIVSEATNEMVAEARGIVAEARGELEDESRRSPEAKRGHTSSAAPQRAH